MSDPWSFTPSPPPCESADEDNAVEPGEYASSYDSDLSESCGEHSDDDAPATARLDWMSCCFQARRQAFLHGVHDVPLTDTTYAAACVGFAHTTVHGHAPPPEFLSVPRAPSAAGAHTVRSVLTGRLSVLPSAVRVYVIAFLRQADRLLVAETCLALFRDARQPAAVSHVRCHAVGDIRREIRRRQGCMFLSFRHACVLQVRSHFDLRRDLALFNVAALRDLTIPTLDLRDATDVELLASLVGLRSLSLTAWRPFRVSAAQLGNVLGLEHPRLRHLHVSAVDEMNADAVGAFLTRMVQLSPPGTVTFTADSLTAVGAVDNLPAPLRTLRVETCTPCVVAAAQGRVTSLCDVQTLQMLGSVAWPDIVRALRRTGACHIMAP